MLIVPSIGPKNAKIAFVGEAPGYEEARALKPFVGTSGKLLEEMLHGAGLLRGDLYITNVVKEHPDHNDISPFIAFGRGEPKVSDTFVSYVEILRDELSIIKPNVVCALGSVALYALTGKTNISNWRGSILESTLVPGLKVIPTYHPAAALREYLVQHYIAHDILKVKREGETPLFNLPDPLYTLKPTLQEALAYLDSCVALGTCSVDIEVVSTEIECIGFAKSSRDSCCIVLYDNGCVFMPEEEVILWTKIAEVLENPDVKKIFQNGAFDCTFIYERYGIVTRAIEDTMIMQGLVTPDFPKGLDFIASIYTDFPYYKSEGKKWYKNPAGSAEGFWIYNCLDTLVTYEAYEKLYKDILSLDLLETYRSHIALLPAIFQMQSWGIKMDEASMRKASLKCDEEIDRLTKELHQLAGFSLNPNSPKQLQNYFYVNKRIKPYSKDGKATTDEKAMIKIAAKGHKEARLILDIRHHRKLKSTYLDVNLDDGRLKCSFNPIGTTTGRLSSSKNIFDLGTNMQNQPKELKKYMYPDEGYIGYNVDLSGADSRCVAFCGPVPIMRDAYLRGIDLHRLTASLLFNIPFEEVSAEPGSSTIGSGMYSQRDWGKKMNHSSNYGIGPNELAYRLEISVAEAKVLLNAYHKQYPEVRSNYQGQIIQMLRNGRRVFNPFGRSRFFLDRWGEGLFQDAYAFFAQSTVADIINRNGLAKLMQIDTKGVVVILNQIHDSIVFQIPLSAGLDYHAYILSELKASLESPITWRAATFSVPADFELMRSSFYDTRKISAPFTAETLAELITN